ncbi:MAG: Fic family protein [Candidatus Margulisiibacteriota bacterium]
MPRYRRNDPYINQAGVYINRLGLDNPSHIQEKETELLQNAKSRFYAQSFANHRFGENDVQVIHYVWLKPLFSWAGKYRIVDLGTREGPWLDAQFIDEQMKDLHKKMQRMTPFTPDMPMDTLIEYTTHIHADFMRAHPFRDGNKRCIGLLCDMLLDQAGRPPKMQHLTDPTIHKAYIKALRTLAESGNYAGALDVFSHVLGK